MHLFSSFYLSDSQLLTTYNIASSIKNPKSFSILKCNCLVKFVNSSFKYAYSTLFSFLSEHSLV